MNLNQFRDDMLAYNKLRESIVIYNRFREGQSFWSYWWYQLHLLAEHYPDVPNPLQQQEMSTLIKELSKKIICRMCRAHFNTYIQKHNYKQFIKSKSLLREYLINLHNSVNLKKKKKIIKIQKVIRFYQNPDIKSKVIDKTGLDVCKYFDQFKIKEFVKLMNRTFYDVFKKKKKILDEKKQTDKPNVINRKQEHWECYLNKYPDLRANYLKGKKPHNRKQAIHHWENHGRNEGRLWGC